MHEEEQLGEHSKILAHKDAVGLQAEQPQATAENSDLNEQDDDALMRKQTGEENPFPGIIQYLEHDPTEIAPLIIDITDEFAEQYVYPMAFTNGLRSVDDYYTDVLGEIELPDSPKSNHKFIMKHGLDNCQMIVEPGWFQKISDKPTKKIPDVANWNNGWAISAHIKFSSPDGKGGRVSSQGRGIYMTYFHFAKLARLANKN